MEYTFISNILWFRARFETHKPFVVINSNRLLGLPVKDYSENQISIAAKYEMLIGMSSGGMAFCFSCN